MSSTFAKIRCVEGGIDLTRLKALFHVNEPGRWPRVLLNVKNFINDVGRGNADIEVLANGAAVCGYYPGVEVNVGNNTLEDMKELCNTGVVFAACRNALVIHAIDEASLPGFVTVVPAGITELVKKQAEGFAYIKP
jgi:intracellular sulfur oxidation DsrE/DsrF family protein